MRVLCNVWEEPDLAGSGVLVLMANRASLDHAHVKILFLC